MLMTLKLSNRRGVLAAGAALVAAPLGRVFAAGDIAGGKPITLLVSYPAGGGADVMARLIAPRMAEALGQPVIVENKPGASGTVAAAQVARATPDGSMLLLDASSFAVNPALFDKLPYDTFKDFVGVTLAVRFPLVIGAHPSVPGKNLKEFKANNLWSEWVRDEDTDTNDARYVVYSYDRHWPLFIYEVKTDMWFENGSKYSVTTSKHKTQSHPYTDTTKLHVDDMIKVKNNGVVGMIQPLTWREVAL
jgi:hypothetical protein